MFIGGIGTLDPVTAALLVIAITLLLLVAQACLKPYMETTEELEGWSGSNNMGVVGYVSQLVVLAVGLVAITFEDSLNDTAEVLLTVVAVVALLVPLGLVTKSIAMMNRCTPKVSVRANVGP